MVGPTPSTAASCSSEAARIASRSPNSVASARAAVGPTCRIDSATSTRHSGRVFATPRLSSRRLPFADIAPALVVNSCGLQQFVLVEGEQVALVGDHRGVEQCRGRLVAEALDVERTATGELEHPLPQLRRAATAFGQRMSTSPSFAGPAASRTRGSTWA